MGTQFTPNSIPRNIIIIMKFLAGLALAAAASAVPIELTPEVATATKEHLAAHAAALKGEHAALAPVQGPAFYLADAADVAAAKPYLPDAADVAAAKPYLADTADVAAAKVEFQKYFDAAAAGTPLTPVTVPVAPVVVPKVESVKVAAPVKLHSPSHLLCWILPIPLQLPIPLRFLPILYWTSSSISSSCCCRSQRSRCHGIIWTC